jgi:hypothetical protein
LGNLSDFLIRHFRVPTGFQPARQDLGMPITAEEAQELIANLSVAEQILIEHSPLLALLDDLYESMDGGKFPNHVNIKTTPAYQTFSKTHKTALATAAVVAVVLEKLLLGQNKAPLRSVGSSFLKVHLISNLRLQLAEARWKPTLADWRMLANILVGADLASHFFYWHATIFIKMTSILGSDAVAADRALLMEIRPKLSQYDGHPAMRRNLSAIDELLGNAPVSPLPVGEAWSDAVMRWIEARPANEREHWMRLLLQLGTCGTTRASAGWIKEVKALCDQLPDQISTLAANDWVGFIAEQPAPEVPDLRRPNFIGNHDQMRQQFVDLGKVMSHQLGVIWLSTIAPNSATPGRLADVVEHVARLPNASRNSLASIGSSAVRALASLENDQALSQLSRLSIRVRWPKLKKIVAKEFDATIASRGLDRQQVEETTIPDFGFRDGESEKQFGNVTAKLSLGRADAPTASWIHSDGKSSRVAPRSLKTTFPQAASSIKQAVSDIEKMRAAQRTRIDLLMRRNQSWLMPTWRQRYLDHGLVGTLARRLIWCADDDAIFFRDGKLVDVEGNARDLKDHSTIRLWHPALRPMDEVLAWREALGRWEITQPFKQAHREIYLLTDAERRTNTYSNRFAAHIVRAPTLLAISQVRHWKSGMFGGASSPCFAIPEYELRAEWWMEPAGQEYTPYGAPLYLATDQVRFAHIGSGDLIPLERVPALALSEIMRDVDLFVGLASVGNDPNWRDGRGTERYHTYWQSYSFGDLSETAKTRKSVLQTLLPRLTKIRDRCSLDEKFLIVKGSLRTYKIHLGSGNILMEPNDQYLCIVPDRSARSNGEQVFLPFEGDSTLSIILSKALLLADDQKITDSTIIRQINR